MSARLVSVVWAKEREYEVRFRVEENILSCTCTVLEHDGVRFVQAVPDLLATLAVSPRLIAAAILAVDAVNEKFGAPGT